MSTNPAKRGSWRKNRNMDARLCREHENRPTAAQIEDLSTLYADPWYSDYTIKTKTRQFDVHRAIVARQSEYLETLFKQSAWKENKERIVDLSEEDPQLVEEALRYIYARSYTVVRQPQKKALEFNIRLYALAEYLVAERLQDAAFEECLRLLRMDLSLKAIVAVTTLCLKNIATVDERVRSQVILYCARNIGRYEAAVQEIIESRQHDSGDNTATSTESASSPHINPFSASSGSQVPVHQPVLHARKRRRTDSDQSAEEVAAVDTTAPPTCVEKEPIEEEIMLKKLKAILREEEPLAWNIACENHTAQVAARERHQAALKQKDEQLQASIKERAELEKKVLELQKAQENDLFLAKLIQRHQYCRNETCGASMIGFGLQKDPKGLVTALRCARCNTKHSKLS